MAGEFNIPNDLVVDGTVDGRDVATDGTKLDGIEAGAQVNGAGLGDHGEYRITTSITNTANGTPAKLAGAGVTVAGSLAEFTHTTPNRLTYTGATTKKFYVDFSGTITHSANNTIITISIAKGGTNDTTTNIQRKVGTAGDVGAVDGGYIFELAENDYLEIFTDADNAGTTTMSLGRLIIMEGAPNNSSGGGGGLTTYTTVALAEAAGGSDNDLCYVVETDTVYRYEAAGSAYTDDNELVLSTNDGGDTRWLGVAGQYVIKSTHSEMHKRVDTGAWEPIVAGVEYYSNNKHSGVFGTVYLQLFEGTSAYGDLNGNTVATGMTRQVNILGYISSSSTTIFPHFHDGNPNDQFFIGGSTWNVGSLWVGNAGSSLFYKILVEYNK